MESLSHTKPIMHLLIIWSEAADKKDYILNDIRKQFNIYGLFKFHWDAERFLDNYTIFYAHSLKQFSRKQLISILQNKITHCGTGDFYVIVFEDPSPKMHKRDTSNGSRIVNINVFDKKTEYRNFTGGGHRIHSSDDAWETNKDLTLLFGLNTEDFLKKYATASSEEIAVNHNCIGVGGYNSIQQLFYSLNNTIKYVVLRNHECLPDEYTLEGHGDIDLLVEDKNYMAYLTLAKPVFPESYRVYHNIRIAGKDIPFDFRYVGDNYYDKPWEQQILKNRQSSKGLFYIPNDEDQFYSLLYHAYIQKHEVKADYLPKLKEYGDKIGVIFNPGEETAITILDNYLKKNSFEYIKPNDITVVYNRNNLLISKYALRYGDFIKRVNEFGNNGYIYTSLVYKKENSYIKRGTKWLMENEVRFLKELEKKPYFPNLISCKNDEDDGILIEISKIKGSECFVFFQDVNHQRLRFIRSFLKETIEILKVLNQKNICHRDFLPANLIVREENGKSKVGLIDFGWAVRTTDKDIKNPLHLGGHYKPNDYYSDLYTFGKMLMDMWYDLPYIRKFSNILTNCAMDLVSQKLILNKAYKYICYYPYSLYDLIRLFVRRHQRGIIIKNKLKSFFKLYTK